MRARDEGSDVSADARATLPWRRIGAYTGAGAISGLANIAIFHAAVGARVAPHAAWALSYEAGGLLAFVLHRHVTWRDRRVSTLAGVLRQFGRAQTGNLLALVANLALFAVLLHAGLPGEEADVAGLTAGFVLNSLLAHHYTYGPIRHRQGWHRPGWTRSRARALHR